MSTNCPICAARAHREAIEALVETGGDLTAVKTLLADRKIEASTYWIRKHFKEHTKITPSDLHGSLIPKVTETKAERETKAAEKARRVEEVSEYLDAVATIDVEATLVRMGVNPNPDSMGEVLTLIQRMSLGLHTVASAIAYNQLERFARDPEGRRYPQLEMRGAKSTSEMVSEAFGTSQATNLQTALDTVERAGFKVVETEDAS
jgi:aspartate-semialdehyde dehydrogenase